MPKSKVRAGWLARCAVVVSLGMHAAAAPSQQGAMLPPDVRAALVELAAQAQVIFAGQVVAVRHGGGEDSSGFVDVQFRVERAMRGCLEGETYTVREWAGVWATQTERYRVGRRLLMLLSAPGRSGFSAPVGGQDGAIPLLATMAAPVWTPTGGAPADEGTATTVATDALVPDLRWVQARATRVIKQPKNGPSEAWAGPVAPMTLGSARAASLVRLRDVAPLLGTVEVAGRVGR